MRLFVYGPDLSVPQPVWMSIFWPHYQALSSCFPTTFLPMPPRREARNRIGHKLRFRMSRKALAPRLVSQVRETHQERGPKILLVYALNTQDLMNVSFLDQVWNDFDVRILNLVDTLQPRPDLQDQISRFDLVLSFCDELAQDYQHKTGVQTLYFPPHTDVLGYHSIRAQRPVDMILVGRRDAASFQPIHQHYSAASSTRLCLDYVTRTQTTPMAQDEFWDLMSMYGRSKIGFCYEASSVQRFRNRSPLTGRWMHVWTAGCTVVGASPKSPAARQHFDWPEATFDLPDDPTSAIALLDELLEDEAGIARRRKRNVIEALKRHDTRKRMSDLLEAIGVAPPETLSDQLRRLNAAVDEVATS